MPTLPMPTLPIPIFARPTLPCSPPMLIHSRSGAIYLLPFAPSFQSTPSLSAWQRHTHGGSRDGRRVVTARPCTAQCTGAWGGTSHSLQHHQGSQPPQPSIGSVAAALTPLLMDASGPPADSRDAEGEKAALHAAVPPMLSAEEDVEQPQRMQLFMAHLMAHLFCCGTLARPHCDIPPGPPEANDPSPPSRGFVPIDRSMPPIMSGRVLHLPASYLFSGGRPSEDDD
ncbi:unnamed protein product [Closterium sp. NIES-65]|nr:unnamed protein product [Closterium sp. NIES-65]